MSKFEMEPAAVTSIEKVIVILRGHRVILDADLARIYEVETGALVQGVKRNLERFPQDFIFQLSFQELANLKSQSVISSLWGGRREFRGHVTYLCPLQPRAQQLASNRTNPTSPVSKVMAPVAF